jgi:GH15 family glucan-1,4-alpha-glucosidase
MPDQTERYPPIGDYAIIGDSRSAALVSRDGGVDWLCWPRFDSPSIFAALLDRRKGGRFVVRPVGDYRSQRRYLPDTVVLETTFETESGIARLLDLMPVAAEAEKRTELWPDHEIMRRIECTEGEVELEILCDPRPDYGRVDPRLRKRGELGLFYEHGSRVLALSSDMSLRLCKDKSDVCGRERLRKGEKRYISLVFAHGEPVVVPPSGRDAEMRIERTIRWWREWTGSCAYEGPFRDAVTRSALTLKLLTYAPSGAVVAAPTTSLPENPGGERNWDYRFCWLRDASMTLQALFELGYSDEGEAFLSWLLHSTRMTRPQLQVAYDVFGEKRIPERELDHLEGYACSRPARVGNAAMDQLQLDTYGEVADAVYEFVSRGGSLDSQTGRLLRDLGKVICRRWREPDNGIWERRGGRRRHTHSIAMCWIGLDRLLRLHEEGHLQVPVDEFRRERSAMREEVETRGYNQELRSYTATLDGDDVDANLLLLSRYGFDEAGSDRMLSTYERIQERLGRNGLLYRYERGSDGLAGGEGAFGICGFWAIETRARQGRLEEAMRMMKHQLSFANDLGLFGEEIDPESGAVLGNFPQAFTHVGLIDAALTLAAERGKAPGAPRRQTEATI